jgi:hypothetical protein
MLILAFTIISGAIGGLIGKLSRSTFTPDDFKSKWYEWLTNQMAHILLGAFMTIIPMGIGYFATGELPSRIGCFFILLFGFSALEIVQGGKISDIIEDIVFIVVYGSGTILLCFKWTHGSRFEGDLFYFVPCFAFIAIHLILGVHKRNYAINHMDS